MSNKHTSRLYYKPTMIINDDSGVVNKLEASLTDDARVIIYDHHMFIVQATAYYAEQYKDYHSRPKKTPNVVKATNSEKLSYRGQT